MLSQMTKIRLGTALTTSSTYRRDHIAAAWATLVRMASATGKEPTDEPEATQHQGGQPA